MPHKELCRGRRVKEAAPNTDGEDPCGRSGSISGFRNPSLRPTKSSESTSSNAASYGALFPDPTRSR